MQVRVRLALSGALLLGVPALGFEAIPSYQFSSHGIVGFGAGGAGFAFSPKTTITVTALGYGCDDWAQQPATVLLLNSNGLALASALASFSSPAFDWAHYTTISPRTLTPGKTYYLWSFWTNGNWTGLALASNGPNQNGTFAVAPDVAYLGEADSTNADGSLPKNQGLPSELLIGPNFIFVDSTMIVLSGLQVISNRAQIGFTVSGNPAASFTLLEADQSAGPWTTNLAAILTTNTPGSAYTFTAPIGSPVQFYRVQTP